MSKGESYQQFIDKLTPTLQAKGWWGKEIDYETGEITVYPGTSCPVELGSPRRLKLIYEQNMQTAFQGRALARHEGGHGHASLLALRGGSGQPHTADPPSHARASVPPR